MGWVLSFENLDRGCRPCSMTGEGNIGVGDQSRGQAESRVVGDPRHAEKQHAREPGDLRCRLPTQQGRSGKANGHKPGMHAAEESDCAVVPMNQPNKGAQASAEVAEGRARTKENTGQSTHAPTQSGERVSQGLGGVRQAARERKQERFTALLHHLTRRSAAGQLSTP